MIGGPCDPPSRPGVPASGQRAGDELRAGELQIRGDARLGAGARRKLRRSAADQEEACCPAHQKLDLSADGEDVVGEVRRVAPGVAPVVVAVDVVLGDEPARRSRSAATKESVW